MADALKPLKKLTRLAVTKEFFRVPVTIDADLELADLDNFWVLVAAEGDPQGEDAEWQAGSWETEDDVTMARVLIGPPDGTIVLTRGTVSDLYLKITDDPEAPVRGPWRITAV